ncbi:xanthan lyase [Verrucomicrobiota bacterium]|nr:xanthan lyase [Verrucomicrobiota bacterium]
MRLKIHSVLAVSVLLGGLARATTAAAAPASAPAPALAPAAAPDAAGLEFFEKRIRPLLAEHCYECHSAEKKTKGGLRLDSRDGWARGGDSGPAVMPGNPDDSPLIKAVRYRDKDFRMPPKRKLSDEQIADFERWVKLGAPDPRSGVAGVPAKRTINVAEGRKHWAYQPVAAPALPAVADTAWPRNEIDRFIRARQEAKGIRPGPDADRVTLIRRLSYDLIGLPPTPAEIDAFVNDRAAGADERLVDRLLASPHFGERWGRHWLDVARFAESLTLRGFVLKEAWRYRDYVIESFNQDRPFDRFVREQVAGDLLPAASLAERRRQVVGTAFLAVGNHNLEEQDKKQLVMDVVDEQLDAIGKAFLGQTIGCARCHDHKFDPIPTRDYYALAGILKNAKTLEHANVSKWLELPLPVDPDAEKPLQKHDAAIAELQARIKEAKDAAAKTTAALVPAKNALAPASVIAPEKLPGIVVDDPRAKRVGEWTESKTVRNFIGAGYIHDDNTGKGRKTVTFIPELPRAGRYEVRLAYVPGSNRAAEVPVTVFSADGEKTVRIDQRQSPPIDGHFVSLGQHRFEAGTQGFVMISNEGTTGNVIADAVQFLPADAVETATANTPAAPAVAPAATAPDAPAVPLTAAQAAAAKKAAKKNQAKPADLKQLEAELKKLTESGPKRPLYLSVKEEEKIEDTFIHIRGLVANPGEKVPRGFLQVATYGQPPAVSATESGRRELAEWLASPANPLTARVMANRVWHWLFGTGLVRTTDNFGTTGEAPSHPELLDHLTARFVANGWSVKKLVREIVLSRTYQLSSAELHVAAATSATATGTTAQLDPASVDPENRLFWHANRRRLDAESIRDTVLLLSGQLQLEAGGSTIKAGTAADYGYKHTDTRRSVYSPVLRNSLPDLFDVFDFADPSMVTGRRNVSTVAPQALFLMNHPFVMEQAQLAAKRLLAEPLPDDAARVARASRLALGRPPSAGELQIATRFLPAESAGTTEAARLNGWAQFYQALFASLDFRYVD